MFPLYKMTKTFFVAAKCFLFFCIKILLDSFLFFAIILGLTKNISLAMCNAHKARLNL